MPTPAAPGQQQIVIPNLKLGKQGDLNVKLNNLPEGPTTVKAYVEGVEVGSIFEGNYVALERDKTANARYRKG